MARRNLMLLTALALTIVSGGLHGYMSQRWGTDDRMDLASARLSRMPTEIGGWRLHESKPLGQSAVEMLQCAGYLNHVYRNESGQQVTVTVMVGPGATISIHTPEICYESRNFSLLGAKRRVELTVADEQSHSLWAVDFETNDIDKQNLRVYYGWSNSGVWSAPSRPRLAFAGERVLYKMQVAVFDPTTNSDDQDAVLQFLNSFVPALQNLIGDLQH